MHIEHIVPPIRVEHSIRLKAAPTPFVQTNMSVQPEKEKDLEVKKGKDLEVKIVPEGTFAGQIDKPVLVKRGEVIPEDTGDQGGGQN